MNVNIDKTVCVEFSTCFIPESDTFNKLNNVKLSYSRAGKCLGVILDESLNFRQLIQMTNNKIFKTVGILHIILAYSPKSILIKLYTALVYPFVTYCKAIWGLLVKLISKGF